MEETPGITYMSGEIQKMKKLHWHKIILSFMLAVCCLVQCFGVVNAADNDIPRVVFENEENSTPDLYISKKVESAEGYEIPDLSFSFTLKLDGELTNRLEYQVFDENGNEVFNYSDGIKVPFTTDRNGVFSLKDGQTAKFEYVGSGVSYEITESETENFRQTEPSGGLSAIGTVTDKGASVIFKNRYIPEDDSKTANLVITKTVSFPDGYEMPETPDFTFTLTVNGKVYADEKYTISSVESGLEIGSGKTDKNGQFTLKGNTFATFTEISTNVDYTVTEISTPGWRTTGSTKLSGSIQSPVTYADFNNVSASFAVTKTMSDNSKPDTDFTFELSGDNIEFPASYYLYTTKGERVKDENGNELELQKTDNNGKFKLKAGQTAIFIGIKTDTVYSVKEEAKAQYIQILPSSSDGYQNKKISDTVEVLPFINKSDVDYIYVLPELGSIGALCLITVGILTISISFILFIRKLKKSR